MSLEQVSHGGRRSVDPTPELAHFDPVTGLAARDLFEERLQQQWDLCQAGHRPLGLLLIDFDDFSAHRAAHDDAAVDLSLIRSARLVSSICRRRADLAARVRSGELAVLLSDVDLDGAVVQAEAIRRGVEDMQIPLEDGGADKRLTVSVGVVCIVPPATHFPHTLIIACDHALKEAKEEGGNRVGIQRRI